MRLSVDSATKHHWLCWPESQQGGLVCSKTTRDVELVRETTWNSMTERKPFQFWFWGQFLLQDRVHMHSVLITGSPSHSHAALLCNSCAEVLESEIIVRKKVVCFSKNTNDLIQLKEKLIFCIRKKKSIEMIFLFYQAEVFLFLFQLLCR